MQIENSISIWISILYRYRRSFLMKKLERYGALGGLYQLVLTLYHNDGESQEQISEHLKTDKAAIARAVQKLEREGYVTRETDSDDKRANKVFLTDKARALVPEIKSTIREWEQLIVSDVPEEAYELIKRHLRQMAENACKM